MATAVMILAFATTAFASDLTLTVSNDGNFTIKNEDGSISLHGNEYMVAGQKSSDGSLTMVGAPSSGSGTDEFGSYSSTTIKWAKALSTDVIMETSFREYASDKGMIVFEQFFPQEIDMSEYAKSYVPVPEPGDAMDKCRIIAKGREFQLTKSAQGYNAYVPSKSGSGYESHNNEYCDDGHQWIYTSDSMNQTECSAKCTSMNCACFDFKASDPNPSPKSSLSASTIFPGFSRNSGPSDDLNCFSYHGVFPSMSVTTVGKYQESHQGGAPITMYASTTDPAASVPMVVFSPLNQPKAHHMASSDSFFGAGVKATVTTIPAGWSQTFLLSSSSGINDGMMAWGDRMLQFTKKPRANMYKDTTHSTIGFWTDNGGYYHYSTGTDKNATYEEVLPKVKAYHDSIGVPFGHWQFDSWFYPKDGAVNGGGGGGSVTNWTAMPSVFPHGMAYIQDQLKVPMVMHNRQWSDKSDYIKNLPQFQWYESKYAVMVDPPAFFEWFFQQQQGWGLAMYEQDWMCTEYDGVTQLQSNISLSDLWLKGMADGAVSSGRTVQFCMPYANDILSASALAGVTNARATGDYFHGIHQWAVGGTALFYWPLGILPFKDGFYSSNNKQVGGQTVGPEMFPDREAIMATLSCAMVGPMDGIELLNKSRTMTTCNANGTVLKPDKPVTMVDWCFTTNQEQPCHVYSTHSDVSGYDKVSYLFQNTPTDVTPAMVGVDLTKGTFAVYNWYTGALNKLSASTHVDAGYEGTVYAVVTPVVNDWVFVGEPNKYVTASSTRFESVSATSSSMTVVVVGAAGETVNVCAAKASDMAVMCKDVQFSTFGTQTVTFN